METRQLSRPLAVDMKMAPADFLTIRDIIYEQSGLFFTKNKIYLLEGRLRSRLLALGYSNFHEYAVYLSSLEPQAEEFMELISLITINETYFFRYLKQLEIFRDTLLPELMERRRQAGDRKIKIWSTAAATGEEPYTLAIMLKETLDASLSQWDVSILGTDISRKMLVDAQKGVYGKNAFRSLMPEHLQQKYFVQQGASFVLQEPVRRMVAFKYLNLSNSQSIQSLTRMDFIFCRNVLMYFDLEMKKRVARNLYNQLNHGGYLFLGEAESLHGVSTAFKVEHFPGTFAYRKE